jgi:2-amino-4-hydroxy-6-hydroxymethyldihydropteridine diphosphokinase
LSIVTEQSHIIYISVGSNVDKEKHTKAGLQGMSQAFGELTLSSVFESESVGFEGNNFTISWLRLTPHYQLNRYVLFLKK